MDKKKKKVTPTKSKSQNKNALIARIRTNLFKNKILLVAAILALLFVVSWANYTITQAIHNTQATSYLEHKYNKQFVVKTNPHPVKAIGDSPTYYGLAYEVSAPDKKIYITRPASFLDFSQQFSDTYLGVAWSAYAENTVKSFLSTIYSPVPKFTVEMHTSEEARHLYDGRISETDFQHALRRYYGSPTDDMNIQSNLIVTVDDGKPLDTQAERVVQIVAFLKNKEFGSSSLTYRIPVPNSSPKHVLSCSVSTQTERTGIDAATAQKCFKSIKE